MFKEVMLYENNRDILKMLIEKVLNVTIENIEILNVESLVSNIHLKNKRLYLNLKTNVGKINVEVNAVNRKYVRKRNMAYLCDMYSHNTLTGEEYDSNIKYIQINLSYGLGEKIKAINLYQVMNENLETYVDDLYIYDVNMDYYMGLWYNKNTKMVSDNIILVMLGLDREDLIELSKKDKVVSKYMKEVERVNEDPEFREYISYEEDQRKIRNTLITEARESGLADGIEQGLEKGIEQGSKNEKYSIAKKLLASGMKVEEIAIITELSEEKIREFEL